MCLNDSSRSTNLKIENGSFLSIYSFSISLLPEWLYLQRHLTMPIDPMGQCSPPTCTIAPASNQPKQRSSSAISMETIKKLKSPSHPGEVARRNGKRRARTSAMG